MSDRKVHRHPIHLTCLILVCCGPPLEMTVTTSSSTTEMPDDEPTAPTGTGDSSSTTSGLAPSTSTTDPSATTGSTGAVPMCGDGVIDEDDGEECDLGSDPENGNRDDGTCTLDCKAAVCGDGKIWAEMEACDNGGNNGSDYAGCSPICQKNAYCGDSVVDVPEEQCDAGSNNGSGMSDQSTIPCEIGCTWDGLVVFLSGGVYDGDLGGLDGADLKCRIRARAAQLRGWETYRAWISSGTVGPLDRFVLLPARPYVLPTGERIADSLGDLVLNGPRDGIRVDEYGKPLPSSLVWTNTGVAGAPYSPVDHCSDWDSAAFELSARVGRSHLPHLPEDEFKKWQEDRHWTSRIGLKCLEKARLYCFEN
jgi:hypothetical protein